MFDTTKHPNPQNLMNDIQIALFKLIIELQADTIKRLSALEQGDILESEGEASMQAALQELLQQAQNSGTTVSGGVAL